MAFSSRTLTPAEWQGLTHFTPDEFNHPEKMGLEFMMALDGLREQAGVPMHPSSDYRSPEYNRSVGGAKDSAHTDTPCDSVDIKKAPTPDDPHWNHARFCIVRAALAAGWTRIGIYPNGSLHLDRTEDRRPGERLWVVVDNPA